MKIEDRILAGAQELFFKYGIKSITMDDIAKHLAISKKTIYLYFKDKNEVVETLMKARLKTDECEMHHSAMKSRNVIEEVFSIMNHISVMFSQMNPILFYELQKYHPNAWKLFKTFKEECVERMVEDSIKRGIREGLVRSDIDTRVIARMRMETLEMGLNPELFPPDKFKIVDVQLALLDHFLHGICTIKGHKMINKYKEISEDE